MRAALRCAAPLLAVALAAVGCVEAPAGPWRPGPPPDVVCDPDEPSVGPTPLRRLTRRQYGFAVLDALGADGDFAEVLGQDERIGGFASNLSAPVDRATLERYLDAADLVVDATDVAALDDCDPLNEPVSDCAARFTRTVGMRLYRRPLDPTEQHRLLALYDEYGVTDHRGGLRMMLRAMLVSPAFLYHADYRVLGPAEGDRVPLDPYALASRLSFFLWSAGPDDALLAAADDGSLVEDAALAAQIDRMLADPRAARGVGGFHRQWLGIDGIETAPRDEAMFPEFSPALAAAMIAETEGFADYVVRRGDGSLTTLLTARWSIVPAALQAHYGLPPGSPTDAPVDLNAGRAGILSHASVLTAGAHRQVSSLTLRGKLIRERVLCHELPEPPPGVDTTLPDPVPGATTRARFEAHVAAEACAGCHRMTDPLGFAYEHFDAVGRWRDRDEGQPVDALGELTATDVDREVEGAVEMSRALAESEQVEQCVARQWFRYALGRQEVNADGCSLATVFDALDAPDDLRQLIRAIALSDSFRHRLSGDL